MYANGFFEQQRRSPASFALVVALHAAGFGALILAGTTQFYRNNPERLTITDIPIPPVPPPDPTRPRPRGPSNLPEQHVSHLDLTPPVGPTTGAVVDQGHSDPPGTGPIGQETVAPRDPPVPPVPVRRGAEYDSRYARDLQPPYPPSEEHAGRTGSVRIRITIGPDGRVSAVERLAATSEAFWQVTQRQALRRWRFRPATLDGRPVQATMTMSVRFEIPGN
jgi:periplasmic protein TonB